MPLGASAGRTRRIHLMATPPLDTRTMLRRPDGRTLFVNVLGHIDLGKEDSPPHPRLRA